MRIKIASDHAGFTLKKDLIENTTYLFDDFGPDSNQSVDYPDFAKKLCLSISANEKSDEKAVLICGSGIGMSIAANRFAHIRAALVYEPSLASLAREHNNANILVLGSRFTNLEKAKEILKIFLETKFDGISESGLRHQRRIEKLKI